jgi:ribonuclease J
MQNLVRPKYFVPVHGEYRMQKVHTELAIECGVKPENNIILECGDVLCLTDKSMRVAYGKVPAGEVYIDGTRIGDVDNSLIQERRALSDDGLFSVIFTLNEKTLEPLVEPQVVSRGFIYMKDSEALTKSFIDFTKQDLAEKIKKGAKLTPTLKNEIAKDLQIFIKSKTDRKPIVVPIFMLVKA